MLWGTNVGHQRFGALCYVVEFERFNGVKS